jgi:hypothetical protein
MKDPGMKKGMKKGDITLFKKRVMSPFLNAECGTARVAREVKVAED